MFPTESAVAEVETPEISSEPSVEETPSLETETGGETTDTGVETEGEHPEEELSSGDEFAVRNGKLSESAKATLNEIKIKNPKLAREMQRALFAADRYNRELPGGVKELSEMRQTLEQAGGIQGIRQVKEELSYFSDLDAAFTSGDPKFITAMTDTPEGQSAFIKLGPSIFEKFNELNPDGYAAYVAKVFTADMGENGIPLALERLGDFIGDNPKAQEILQSIKVYTDRIKAFASKPVMNAPKRTDAAPRDDSRERELTTREENLTKTEWRGAADAARVNFFNGEFERQTKALNLTPDQKSSIKELYASRLQNKIGNMKDFTANGQRFFSARDKDGFLRYVTSVYKQEIPEALRAAIKVIAPGRAGSRTGATASAKPGSPTVASTTPAPDKGFTWIAKVPSHTEIDTQRTTRSMFIDGKAILLNGRKVQFHRA